MQLSNNHKSFSEKTIIMIAEIIVKKFVANGSFNYGEFNDVKQAILEKFFLKKKELEKSFSNKVKPETFITAVFYKMTLEIIRERQKREKKINDYNDISHYINTSKSINPEEKLIIEYEKEYLKRIFLTFGNEQNKVILFLKVFFKMKIKGSDVLDYFPEAQKELLDEIIEDNNHKKDKELYLILANLLEKAENKIVKIDAVRMYVNKNIDKILKLLNNRRERSFYNKESLMVLMEQTF